MDFTLSERETYFRDRVRDFIAREISPRNGEYVEQVQSGERWKVIPVIERQGGWPVELLHAAALRPDPCR